MNPIEWLATLLWDRDGHERTQQRYRIVRGNRKLQEFDEVNKRAMRQIRRAQEIGNTLTQRPH